MSELVDTTEMYLKSIYEMMEDGVVPLRARIVERLGHSGPTVSQTIARMERDGLVTVEDDRHIMLSKEGMKQATSVMRKHRLAELLLTEKIGMSWVDAHDEACRWEHVMSEQVEQLLGPLLKDHSLDPYGNPIPDQAQAAGKKILAPGTSLAQYANQYPEGGQAVICRIGEPLQATEGLLQSFFEADLLPGSQVCLSFDSAGKEVAISGKNAGQDGNGASGPVVLNADAFKHFFVELQ